MGKLDVAVAKLVATAGRQCGLFTFRQAVEAGVPRSTLVLQLNRGRWTRIMPNVYRFAGTPASEEAAMMAAWLSVGEPAAVSGTGAAFLWGLTDRPPATRQLVVPNGRRVSRPGLQIVRTRRWTPAEMAMRGVVRATSPRRTLLDLAARVDELELELMLDEAHRLKLVTLETLIPYVEEAVRRRIRGAVLMRDLLAVRDPARPPDSKGETGLLRRLRRAGLPLPVLRFWVRTRAGLRRIDLAYPDHKVALEFDSYRWHEGRARFDADRIRDSELADLGWERRHITSAMVADPAPTLEWTVAIALGLRPTRWRPVV